MNELILQYSFLKFHLWYASWLRVSRYYRKMVHILTFPINNDLIVELIRVVMSINKDRLNFNFWVKMHIK